MSGAASTPMVPLVTKGAGSAATTKKAKGHHVLSCDDTTVDSCYTATIYLRRVHVGFGVGYPQNMAGEKYRVVFFHPDLGIGGAERLVIDAAVGLQSRGHEVTIFTSHCDPQHCFDEARDGEHPQHQTTCTAYVRHKQLSPDPHTKAPSTSASVATCSSPRRSSAASPFSAPFCGRYTCCCRSPSFPMSSSNSRRPPSSSTSSAPAYRFCAYSSPAPALFSIATSPTSS